VAQFWRANPDKFSIAPKERQDISIVSDTGVKIMRHEDRCTVLLDYGIEDAVALLKVASEAMEYMGVKDVECDKSVRGLANAVSGV
jgi:hypothetical protein